ncbi:hypothetical protein [Halomicrococcus sp. NG-SE-24]|uniref:hypothetical protein n=1 Tax=Halomicrococcus sp. NG-SE-24 TaxID=3436928 RepID=UPI003D963B63
MVTPAVIDTGFGVAGLLTLLVAGYWGVARHDHRRALRTGAFVVLWLAGILLNGWRNMMIMAVAMATLSFVWFLTRPTVRSQIQ